MDKFFIRFWVRIVEKSIFGDFRLYFGHFDCIFHGFEGIFPVSIKDIESLLDNIQDIRFQG